jgi:uncharacterized membrane protein
MTTRRPELAQAAALVTVTIVVASLDAPFALRLIAGSAVLLLPGYAWSRVLFPTGETGAAERTLSTLALAVANVITITVLLYRSPWPLTARSWAIGTAAAGFVALVVLLLRPDRTGPRPPWGNWPLPRRRDVVLVGLSVVVLAATAVLAFRPLSPPTGVTGYTELSLSRDGNHVVLGVASFELHSTHYRIELARDGVVTQTWEDVALDPSRSWTQVGELAGTSIEARLYRHGDDPTTPYRNVRLLVAPATTAPP